MKQHLWAGMIVAASALPLAACSGGNSSSPSSDTISTPENFTGTTWKGTSVFTASCSGFAPSTTTDSYSETFVAEGSGIALQGGCTVTFSVSGNTASLSNAPHCVGPYGDGGAEAFAYAAYTLTSADGHTLTGTNSGTLDYGYADAGFTDCTFTNTIMATR
jgi:hypothetical protein